jgi:hypothetical protein
MGSSLAGLPNCADCNASMEACSCKAARLTAPCFGSVDVRGPETNIYAALRRRNLLQQLSVSRKIIPGDKVSERVKDRCQLTS